MSIGLHGSRSTCVAIICEPGPAAAAVAAHAWVRAVREAAADGIVEAAKKQGGALWPQLTPAQQEEFLRINEPRRAHWQRNNAR